MKVTAAALAALAATAAAGPTSRRQEAGGCDAAVTLDASTNVWQNYKLHANNFYRSEIEEAAAATTDAALKEKMLKVADIGTFVWV